MRVQIVILRLVITSLNMEICVCYRPKADAGNLLFRPYYFGDPIDYANIY